jgi:hypothetical protein
MANYLFLDDAVLEKYILGADILNFNIIYDSGVPSLQPVGGVIFPHLLQAGQYDGININPNTILNQANIDAFLGEAGVVDDAPFQYMPDDDSSVGVLFKFSFDYKQVFLVNLIGNNNKTWSRRAANPSWDPTQPTGVTWQVFPLSAGGFAFGMRFRETNLVASFRDSSTPFEIFFVIN